MSHSKVKLSKSLSWILRHGAEKERLVLKPGGWVRLADVLKRPKFKKVVEEEIKQLVANCPKQRFGLKKEDGELYIRANQGHSLQFENTDLEEITNDTDVPLVVHGTYYHNWTHIKEQGLHRASRTHIHFATGLPKESEVISGMRKSSQIYIYVDLAKALAGGLKFYKSVNNVILCPGNEEGFLSPEYFLKVVDRTGKCLQ